MPLEQVTTSSTSAYYEMPLPSPWDDIVPKEKKEGKVEIPPPSTLIEFLNITPPASATTNRTILGELWNGLNPFICVRSDYSERWAKLRAIEWGTDPASITVAGLFLGGYVSQNFAGVGGREPLFTNAEVKQLLALRNKLFQAIETERVELSRKPAGFSPYATILKHVQQY